jgi:hypothetical protein
MRLAVLGTVLVLAAAGGVAAGSATVGPATADAFVDTAQVDGRARFDREPADGVATGARTVPTWSGSFVSGGATYTFTMVGTDPAKGPARTAVKTVIVPLDVRLSAGLRGELRGSDRTQAVLGSPVFRPTDFSVLRNAWVPGFGPLGDQSGPPVVTQYGNAVQKAMFWQTGGSNPGYEVLLAEPAVLAAQRIDVPASHGYDLIGSVSGKHFALVSKKWFVSRLKNLLGSLQIEPDVLPIFVSDSVFLYRDDPSVCCVIGLHGASSSLNGKGRQSVNTYIYAVYSPVGVFQSPTVGDIHGLTHELSSWYADPFVSNVVPSWSSVTAPAYGCSPFLETGDPVVGHGFVASPVGSSATYHPQDQAFYSWFAREQSSRGFGGRYTFMQNPSLTGFSQGC